MLTSYLSEQGKIIPINFSVIPISIMVSMLWTGAGRDEGEPATWRCARTSGAAPRRPNRADHTALGTR